MSQQTKPFYCSGPLKHPVSPPSVASGGPDPASHAGSAPRHAGHFLALALAALITLALVAWTVGPRPNPSDGRGRITFTIVDGNVTLTTTESVTGCTPWTNGTQGVDLSAAFGYTLTNHGSAPASITVIVALAGSPLRVVAQHLYTLAPFETVDGTIGADVPLLGVCPTLPLMLGVSSQGSA